MKRKNDILYDILDQYTGEPAAYKKVTTYADGTAMSDAKCDGVIYRKKGGEYFKRICEYGLIEWYTGENAITDGIGNYNAVCKIAKAGLPVKLKAKAYPLAAATNISVNTDTEPLIIYGEGEKQTKIILQTKHSVADGRWKYGYFTGSRDIRLNNLTLTTQNYEAGNRTEINAEYRLCAMYKPNKTVIELNSTTVNGALSFVFLHNQYGSTSTTAEQLEQYVKHIKCNNCTFNYVNKVFYFTGTFCRDIFFTNGAVYELLGNIVQAATPSGFASVDAGANKLVVWDNMHVKNTIIPTATDWYHTPLVVECDTVDYKNSSVTGLINKDKTVRVHGEGNILGAETYALYASCNNLRFNNNTIKNVLGQKEDFNDNCVFKIKGSVNVQAKNNSFVLEKQALVDAGVISSIASAYSTIDKNKFLYCFFGMGRTNITQQGEFIFRNNIVRIPYLNKECYVPVGRVDISNNKIEVDYVAISRGGTRQVLFYNYLSGSTPLAGYYARVDNNIIRVNGVESTAKPVRIFGEEVAQYTSLDQLSYADFYSISNNNFFGSNITFELGIARTGRLLYTNNKVTGKNADVAIDSTFSSTLAANIPFSLIEFSSEADAPTKLKAIHPLLWGVTKISLKNNNQDSLLVLSTGLNDWNYNSYATIATPVLINVELSYQTNEGLNEVTQFNIAQTATSNIRFKDKATGAIANFDPRAASDSAIMEIAPKKGQSKAAKLTIQRFADRTCKFYITGLEGISDFEIKIKVGGQTVDAANFYNKHLLYADKMNGASKQTLDNSTMVTIAHSFGRTPSVIALTPQNVLAATAGWFAKADDSNIVITYPSALSGEWEMSWQVN
jgi:hypothetical protein